MPSSRRRPQLVLVDELAHTNAPGSPPREALAGRRGAARRRHRRHLDRQHPAPRVAERRRRADHRDPPARDDPRPRGAGAPTTSSSSTWPPRPCGGASPTATSTPPTRSTPPSATTSAPATCRRLRELALLWVADRVDDALQDYRERHGITRPWETRERIVVALAGAPDTDHLIRRAARMAQRAKGDLIGVHVVADSGLSSGDEATSAEVMGAQRRLLEELGGEYRRVTGNDVAAALVDPRPSRERHPDRARRQRPLALAGALRRLGDQPSGAPVGADRRPRHLAARRSVRRERAPPASGSPGADPTVTASAGAGVAPRRRRPAADHARLRQPARAGRAPERAAALPRAGDGGGPRRRRAPRPRRGRRRLPARQLVLHATVLRPDDHRRGERVRPPRVRLRRRNGGHPRRSGRAESAARGPAPGRGRGARLTRRFPGPAGLGRRDARPAAGDVRVPHRVAPRRARDRMARARDVRSRRADRSRTTPTSPAIWATARCWSSTVGACPRRTNGS